MVMTTKQKVNGRNYGARGTKEPETKPEPQLSESIWIARDALMTLLETNKSLVDEVKFLKAKLDQAEKVNKTLKTLIVSTKVIG